MATGPALITIPDVVGLPYGQAVLAIQQAGLEAWGIPESSSYVTFGIVISTNPPGGIQIAPNSTVTVYYSQPTATPTTNPPTRTSH
jgi:eukaryotic-like serine/threonine-protein kinase